MARKGVDEVQVFQAAQELKDKGVEPTIQAIREKLGTGSYATISHLLKKWRELKVKESPVPKETEDFQNAMKRVWSIAYREAENNFTEMKKAYLLEKDQLLDEKEHILKELERVEFEGHKDKSRVEELEAFIKKEDSNYKKLATDYHSLKEKIARLQVQFESSEERRKEAVERSNRLEKELAAIAKAKK